MSLDTYSSHVCPRCRRRYLQHAKDEETGETGFMCEWCSLVVRDEDLPDEPQLTDEEINKMADEAREQQEQQEHAAAGEQAESAPCAPCLVCGEPGCEGACIDDEGREPLSTRGLRGEAYALVEKQIEDEGLWFVAKTASEAYLQRALRELHAAVEKDAVELSARRLSRKCNPS